MLKQTYFLFSLILTLTLLSSPAFTQVTVSIPVDLSANPGDTGGKIPVNVSDVTGLNVISADLIISYDTSVLTATGATLDGTIAAGGQVTSNFDFPAKGQITVGITKTLPPLSESGVLVFILFDVEESPPTNISELSFSQAKFNEVPADQITDGQITILPGDKRNVGTGTSNLSEGNGVPIDISWDNDPGGNATFAAIQFDSPPDVTTGLLGNFPSTYWELWIADSDSFQADVTFHYDNIGGIGDEANLQLYMRGASGQSWAVVTSITLDDEGNNTDGIGSITAVNLTNFSQFILTSDDEDNSLPVLLCYFTAATQDSNIILKWQTATELNNLGFAIFRSEEREGKYIKIGFVKGAGSSEITVDYQFTDGEVEEGKAYFYYLEDINISGVKNKNVIIRVVVKTSVSASFIPKKSRLLQNYPNPFNPETWIPYELAADSTVSIDIYNVQGQLIRHLALKEQKAGSYLMKDKATCWDGRDEPGQKVASGVYWYRLRAGQFNAIRRMVITK